MTKKSLIGLILVVLAFFASVGLVKAITCGNDWNGYPTRDLGDGYCWAKVFKIEPTNDNPGDQGQAEAVTWYRDGDGDGYGNPKVSKKATTKPEGYVDNNLDCNDGNKKINPKAKEICDNTKIDENCNGVINEGCAICYLDADKDGYGSRTARLKYFAGETCPKGYAPNNTDCNDANNAINPAAKENCYDRKDNNCDGRGDDGRGKCY